MLGDFVRWGAIFGGFSRDDDRDGGGLSALLLAIVAPFAAMLLQLAISRQREFEADRLGAQISQKPLALASALQKLDAIAHAHPVAASPATSHLFIVSPFGGAGGLWSLFRTHPLTEQRVARLQELAWGAR
jgi:heat shock protein HtpX